MPPIASSETAEDTSPVPRRAFRRVGASFSRPLERNRYIDSGPGPRAHLSGLKRFGIAGFEQGHAPAYRNEVVYQLHPVDGEGALYLAPVDHPVQVGHLSPV